MTIYAAHLREIVLLMAAMVIFADATFLNPVLKLSAVGFTGVVFIFHLGHLARAIRHQEAVRYGD